MYVCVCFRNVFKPPEYCLSAWVSDASVHLCIYVCIYVSQLYARDWSKRFMQVILTNQIQAVNATSTWRQAGTRLVGEQRRPKRQPVPSNVKPCNYKHKTFDSRKCTEAGINSCITVPSKVRASQDPTKKRVTCLSKSVRRVVCFGWGLASAPLPRQVLSFPHMLSSLSI